MSADPAIEATGLTRKFGRFVAVDRVDIRVRRGSIFGFLGPNGSGKTTAIRMLSGLLRPTAGSILVDGIDVRRHPEEAKRRIGYMTQHFSLYEELTLDENLDFYCGIYSGSRSRRDEMVEMLALGPYLGRQAREVPGGIRQKLSLCSVVLHDPPILFLDEPTAGVDPVSRRAFWDIITELSHRGTTVFLTTHFLDEAEYCHDLGFIRAGRVLVGGSPSDLRQRFADTVLVEVQTPDFAAAERVLASSGAVADTYLHGPRIHAFARPGLTEADVRHVLEGAGHERAQVRTIPLSMEDIFISLTASPGEGGDGP